MNKEIYVDTASIREAAESLRAGDRILLSGTVYCARDAAHKKIIQLLREGKELPFPIRDSVIYYCGPTPAKPGMPIGSCGPTTSSRMDTFMPALLDLGLAATIGKGPRSPEVRRLTADKGAVYLCAMGGAGAVAAESIEKCDVIAFDELGCESVKKMLFRNFPLIVGNDIFGGSVFF